MEKKEAENLTRSISVENGQVMQSSSSESVPELHGEDLKNAIEHAVNHRRLNSRQIQLTSIAGSIGAYVLWRDHTTRRLG